VSLSQNTGCAETLFELSLGYHVKYQSCQKSQKIKIHDMKNIKDTMNQKSIQIPKNVAYKIKMPMPKGTYWLSPPV
jgi:hypothetical protein